MVFTVRNNRAVQGNEMTSRGAAGRIGDGLLLFEKGNYYGAEVAFRAAIGFDAACAEAYLHLGWTLLNLDQNLEAGAAFKSAIRLNPDAAGAHEGLGLVLANERRYPAAEAAFRDAVRLEPASGLTRCRLAESLYAQGRYLEAEIAFRDAIRADPGLAAAHAGLGWALLDLKESAEAAAAFRAAIGLDPGNQDVERELAGLERNIGGSAGAGYRWVGAFQPRAEQRAEQRRRGRPGTGRRPLPSPVTLLRSPRARPLRRFLAGAVDVCLIPACCVLFAGGFGWWGVPMGVAVYALNGYVEGTTGQSFGKMLTGLHTIHGTTGRYLGGSKGMLRRFLLLADYGAMVTFVIGLFAGQTIADVIMGTVVVWRPARLVRRPAG